MADLIRREDVLQILNRKNAAWTGYQWVSELPAVDAVEVKHGRWLFEEYPDEYYHAVCSNCEMWCDERAYKERWNYCPNCGAKMDGGNNETD